MADILEKFTAHLKNVLAKGYSLAVELDSLSIGPEHLLLALLQQKGSVGGELLRKTEVGTEEIRRVLRLSDELLRRDGGDASGGGPRLSADAKRAVEKAVLTANVNEHKYVGTEHLLAGILQIDSPAIEAILSEQNINSAELRAKVDTMLKSTSKFPEITETFEGSKTPKDRKKELAEDEAAKTDAKKRPTAKSPKSQALEFFSVDLTDRKAQENIDPVIGRDKEIERLVQILCRRTKNNPVLLGEAGVGKTAIVEGLAKRILAGDVPEVLAGKRILSLDLGMIIAGTIYRGEFESRVKQIIDEVKSDPDIILFIDELHNITGAGSTSGSLDAANILKPALARGDLRCIGATTPAEFKKSIESDAALERRFQPIIVEPPSPEVTVEILRGLRDNYEHYHGVKITDDAIEAAVKFSDRYVQDRFLPDKAIDLMDEAAACVRVSYHGETDAKKLQALEDDLQKIGRRKQKAVTTENFIEALELQSKEKALEADIAGLKRQDKTGRRPVIGEIGRRDIAAVISRATGIPITDLLKEEKARLLKLEETLRAHIIGQDEAVTAVAELVRRAKAGIASPNRPLASFLFLGPSGVGKTELAKTLAVEVLQDPEALVRIDMSEFAEGFNVSKLIGAPAGYVGYKDRTKLTDVVKRKPHSIVLFDEIEKAHGEIHNLLLQILEDGHITDATGRKINFKNAIIVMTSNVGASKIGQTDIGFGSANAGEYSADQIRDANSEVMKELERSFRPEFLNRIDKIISFKPLAKKDLEFIARLQLGELAGRLERDYGIRLAVDAKAAELIAERSWNPLYGARGVRRQIQDLIENPLSRELLAEKFVRGETVTVKRKEDQLILAKRQTHARVAG
ncbi:MAG: ATP-dependent Clp protease ATP-binding subunit [Patescibacteria group bacterium]|jgi:ATP-dependent Clp protease ATP-binding subunit ClpC